VVIAILYTSISIGGIGYWYR